MLLYVIIYESGEIQVGKKCKTRGYIKNPVYKI